MIVFTLRILVAESNRRQVIASFEPLVAWTRVQPGCRACHLLTDIEDPRGIILLEEWDTQGHLDRHLRSEVYRRVIAAIELSEEEPQIHFDTVASRAGIEVVEAARAG